MNVLLKYHRPKCCIAIYSRALLLDNRTIQLLSLLFVNKENLLP